MMVPRFLGEMLLCFSMLMSHYVIVQFTILYIGVVESRQWTRAAVSCSAFVGIK